MNNCVNKKKIKEIEWQEINDKFHHEKIGLVQQSTQHSLDDTNSDMMSDKFSAGITKYYHTSACLVVIIYIIYYNIDSSEYNFNNKETTLP